uniref:Ig-like domain-containing protein n=1 Tax=Monopterus albus TaxID=43700 RepID=A0A3Q3JCN9_MONAL
MMFVYISFFKICSTLCIFCPLSIEMYPPVFVSTPDPMTLCVGKQAVLQCSLTGSSPMEVVWHKDNIAISSRGNYLMKCDKNKYTLHIKSLELTDQGVYLCKASNTSAAVNDPLRLECQVDEDTGVTVTWTRDGKKVHQSMECKLSFEDKVAVLDIPKTKLRDSGKYVCTAANEAGTFFTFDLQTSVLVILFVLFLQGAAGRLQCGVKGSPELHIHWFLNERELSDGEKYKISFKNGVATLEIMNLLVTDSGSYTCEVSNNAGSESCQTLIAVKGLSNLEFILQLLFNSEN